MSDNVYLNADKTKVVEEWTFGKKWQVPRAEAVKLGLLDSADKPVQQRRAFDATKATAPVEKPQRRRTSKRK